MEGHAVHSRLLHCTRVAVHSAGADTEESRWRGIKACTAGEARKLLESTVDENGYEAWYELTRNLEPAMEAKRIRTVGEVYSMPAWKANKPSAN